jgi:2Fe-2S ferredoxin
MPEIHIISRDGAAKTVTVHADNTIKDIIRDAGFDELQAICGGACSCATCHIYVAEHDVARMPEISADEHDLLDCSPHRKASSRLSCQVKFSAELDGLTVSIAPED